MFMTMVIYWASIIGYIKFYEDYNGGTMCKTLYICLLTTID